MPGMPQFQERIPCDETDDTMILCLMGHAISSTYCINITKLVVDFKVGEYSRRRSGLRLTLSPIPFSLPVTH